MMERGRWLWYNTRCSTQNKGQLEENIRGKGGRENEQEREREIEEHPKVGRHKTRWSLNGKVRKVTKGGRKEITIERKSHQTWKPIHRRRSMGVGDRGGERGGIGVIGVMKRHKRMGNNKPGWASGERGSLLIAFLSIIFFLLLSHPFASAVGEENTFR